MIKNGEEQSPRRARCRDAHSHRRRSPTPAHQSRSRTNLARCTLPAPTECSQRCVGTVHGQRHAQPRGRQEARREQVHFWHKPHARRRGIDEHDQLLACQARPCGAPKEEDDPPPVTPVGGHQRRHGGADRPDELAFAEEIPPPLGALALVAGLPPRLCAKAGECAPDAPLYLPAVEVEAR